MLYFISFIFACICIYLGYKPGILVIIGFVILISFILTIKGEVKKSK